MKLFMATLGTETNTFSPIPTARAGFADTLLNLDRDASTKPPNLFTEALHVWRRRAEEEGWDVVESIAAFAQPAGMTVQSVWEELRDMVVGDLKADGPVDVILIQCHGAMVSQSCLDCEGELMSILREIAPDAVIGLELDPHNHMTDRMLEACDLIVNFKEYSHIDATPRAEELFTMAADMVKGRTKPVMAMFDCRMIGFYPTNPGGDGPMRDFVDAMIAAPDKQPGLLHLTLTHGFPWGDVPETGTRMIAIVDGDAKQAAETAERWGKLFWDLRDATRIKAPNLADGLTKAAELNGAPIVLADMADNAGGGAPADSTFVLREVLDRGLTGVAMAIFYDPSVVRLCADAGVGATLPVRLGGKHGPASGDPVDLVVTVKGHATDLTQPFGGGEMEMGEAVWLESDGIDLIVNDTRTQCFSPEAFERLGCKLADRKIVVVKSSNHFYAGFAPIAEQIIYCATPGTLTPDATTVPYTRRTGLWWPKDEDPWITP
ncbi:M81 family metallopeptidase [Seohaeicola saemankumensis]|uniref:M81 family metallopeptidase n=1 Tax=Seohaeicola saemankumensis TaxID=481181 RepID=UPI0035CF6194